MVDVNFATYKIIPIITLPQVERELPFTFSVYPIRPLQKIHMFKAIFFHTTILYVTLLLIILRGLKIFFAYRMLLIDIVFVQKLTP